MCSVDLEFLLVRITEHFKVPSRSEFFVIVFWECNLVEVRKREGFLHVLQFKKILEWEDRKIVTLTFVSGSLVIESAGS